MSKHDKYANKERAHDKHLRLFLERSLDEHGIKPHQYGAWIQANKADFIRLTYHFIRSRI